MISGKPFLRVFSLLLTPFLLTAAFLAVLTTQEAMPPEFAQQPILPRATPQNPGLAVLARLTEGTEIRAGPGSTYEVVAPIPGGTEVTLIARSRVGNWVEIQTGGDLRNVRGWIQTGYVAMDGIRLSTLTVRVAADADMNTITDPNLLRLFAAPIVPEISESMRVVYAQGQALGNLPNMVVKVGDSNSANPYYLVPIRTHPVELGPYDFLQDAVAFFGPTLPEEFITARVGLNTYSLFDPSWADRADCTRGETPLACEYRLTKPAIAIVMFGPNDIRALNSERYREQMARVVEESLAAGVIPVLTTFSSSERDADLRAQAIRFNLIIVETAGQYQVPLINLWAAAQTLPNYGIGSDGVHMTVGGGRVNFTEGQEARYGVSLQNLLVLHTLDTLRREIITPFSEE